MKKAIAVIMILALFISSITCAYATDTQGNGEYDEKAFKQVSIEELREKLTDISVKFPEARINVEADIEYARQLADMPVREQLDHYRDLVERGPIETYKHVEEDGSYAVLNIYGPLALASYGADMGASTLVGNDVIYSGTKVWADHICNILLAYAWYYVNHTYSYEYLCGWLNGLPYSVYSYGGISLAVAWYCTNSTNGTYADVWYRVYEIAFDNAYAGTISLQFDASTFNVSADYIADPYI